jgi:dipeptidyl aminopeptidase/acylaminoacyl peptidase
MMGSQGCQKSNPLEQKKNENLALYPGTRRLTDNINDINPKWSPAGEKIAFERNENIYMIDVYSGAIFLMATNGRSPCWSPDGNYIAFVRNGELFQVRDLVPNTQGIPQKISNGAYASDICGIDWGSTNRIAYFQPGDSLHHDYRLISYDLSNQNYHLLAREQIGYGEKPEWSGDGEYVLFSTQKMGLCIYSWEDNYFYSIVFWGLPVAPCWYSQTDTSYVLFIERGVLYRINPDGTDRKVIIDKNFYAESITYNDQRRQLAFNNHGIWIMDFPPEE